MDVVGLANIGSFLAQVLLLGHSATKKTMGTAAILEEAESELDVALQILDDRSRCMRSYDRRPLLDEYKVVKTQVKSQQASAPQWKNAEIRTSAAAFWKARSKAKEMLKTTKKLTREVKDKSAEALQAYLARSSTTTLVTSQGSPIPASTSNDMLENGSSPENTVSPLAHEISTLPPEGSASRRESIIAVSESNSASAESTLSPSEYNPLPSESESTTDPFRDPGIPNSDA